MRCLYSTRPLLLLLWFLGLAISTASAAAPQWPAAPSRLVFDTPYGTLQVKDKEYIYESRLYLDEADIAPVIEGLLNIPYAFSLPSAHIALVSINSGDLECPVSYRWVVLRQNEYSVSQPFGSCSEHIEVTVQGRSFVVKTPSSQMPDKIDVYAYDGKTVRKRTQH